MSQIRMVRTINPVSDPGASTDRRDFFGSQYRFDRVADGIAIHSLLRPDSEVTIVFEANISCVSVTTEMPPVVVDSPRPDWKKRK